MKLYFIRHGQTDFNKEGRVQGQEVDLPLNDLGLEQVEAAVENVPENIDLIISSPLKRTRQTAEIINKKFNKEVQFHDAIKEISFGTLSGKTWPEIESETEDPAIREKCYTLAFDHRRFGGESADDLKRRVAGFAEEMADRHADKTVLVIAHGGIIETMHVLFPQKEKPERENASIHVFEI